jgi:hypothetical protein
MRKSRFWKVAFGFIFMGNVYGASDILVGSLSEGSCWYQFKDSLHIASFNDKSTYVGSVGQIEADFEARIAQSLKISEHVKINEMDLSLHCGGYGASLVAKATTDNNEFCVWAKFDQGHLSIRSIGTISGQKLSPSELCDGHTWGEFIMGVNSDEPIAELQSSKWSSMIKSVTGISKNVYKVILTKDYELREQEVISQIQVEFIEKKRIRFIEFNSYNHPIGEFVHLR